MDNVYSFTTNESDPYLDRVIAEATPDTNFILTTERSTVNGEGNYATLTFRKKVAVLAFIDPSLTLGRRTLVDWFESFVAAAAEDDDEDEWAQVVLCGLEPEALVNEIVNLTNEIKRLKNIIEGRTVRVTVQAF